MQLLKFSVVHILIRFIKEILGIKTIIKIWPKREKEDKESWRTGKHDLMVGRVIRKLFCIS